MQQLKTTKQTGIGAAASPSGSSKVMQDWFKQLLPFLSLLILCAAIPLCEMWVLGKDPKFLTPDNLAAIARQTAVITIMAMGMTMVMVSGGIDLSVGSIIGLASVIGAMAMAHGSSSLTGIMISIAVGAACGLLNGATVNTLKIPAFIVTLGGMGIYRGLALYVSDGNAITGLPDSSAFLAEKNIFSVIPFPLIITAVTAIVIHFILSRTRLGRYCYAMGSNPEAARFAGLPVLSYRIIYYIILGGLSGLGGAIETSRTMTGQPNGGETYELNVIAAVVIGGGSLSGGQGTVIGTIIGSLIMGVLANGGNLLQISPFIQKIVIGSIIILAVTFDEYQRRKLESSE